MATTATPTTAYAVDAAQLVKLEAREVATVLANLVPTRSAGRTAIEGIVVATPQEAARTATEKLAGVEATRDSYRDVADKLSNVAATRSIGTRVTEARINQIFADAGLGQGRTISRGIG